MSLLRTSRRKVFCVGRNKTGTTSLAEVFRDLGFSVGSQKKAERFVKDYSRGNWKPLIRHCRTAEVFQDAPFSWPYTWLILHEHFPSAQFVLTTRDPEEWYESVVRFHGKKFSRDGGVPTKEDLMAAEYNYKGMMWDFNRAIYKTPENDPYNKEEMIRNYETHNYSIRHFFKDRPNFIEIDVSVDRDYLRLCDFLGREPVANRFPHLNASK
ncbi:MAG: hypothetical protein IPM63_10370 [Acidobacteriota bacterium]|nr:MAG: hypothetical protein IPM63_10370 [Acidobacteriota bacterium]